MLLAYDTLDLIVIGILAFLCVCHAIAAWWNHRTMRDKDNSSNEINNSTQAQ